MKHENTVRVSVSKNHFPEKMEWTSAFASASVPACSPDPVSTLISQLGRFPFDIASRSH